MKEKCCRCDKELDFEVIHKDMNVICDVCIRKEIPNYDEVMISIDEE